MIMEVLPRYIMRIMDHLVVIFDKKKIGQLWRFWTHIFMQSNKICYKSRADRGN